MRFFPAKKRLPANAWILLVRFSSLGDVTLTTGLPRQIKKAHPSWKIAALTSLEYAELYRHNPWVDKLFLLNRSQGFSGFSELLAELKHIPFQLYVDVHRSLRSRLLWLCLGFPRRTYYSKHSWKRHLLVSWKIPFSKKTQSKQEDFLAGLRPYGIENDKKGTELHFPSSFPDSKLFPFLSLLKQEKARGKAILGVACGSRWPLKRWPLENWKLMLETFLQQKEGFLVFFGSQEEAEEVTSLGLPQAQSLVLCGQLSPLESAFFVTFCQVLVGNDSAMLHLAEAAQVPALGLYGPTTREWGYFPSHPKSFFLEEVLSCRPCSKTGKGVCSHPWEQACMKSLSPQQVLLAVNRFFPPSNFVLEEK